MFNRAGEVIGIDVQIYGSGERNPGVTFAIPIDMAMKVRAQVLQAQRQARQQAQPPMQQAQQAQQAPPAAAQNALGVDAQDVGRGSRRRSACRGRRARLSMRWSRGRRRRRSG